MKKILYLSVHEILEYDELKLFTEMGHKCYSLGAYTQPGGEEHRKRPPLELPYNPHFIELALQYPKEALHTEQLWGIDIVIIMHEPKLVENNWPVFEEFIKKGGRVIWRTIGQSIPHVEHRIAPFRDKGLEIVRYSPTESTIQGYVGEDAIIRFYKDPQEYKGWSNEIQDDIDVINFTQSLKQRAEFTGYETILAAMAGFRGKVYGPGNEDLGELAGGLLSYEQQCETLKKARAYIYFGTYPASYTLSFIEAMMTGVPIVAVGAGLGNGPMFSHQSTYEVNQLLEDGVTGYVRDDIGGLRSAIQELVDDHDKASSISTYARSKAIELFGKERIKAQWEEFLTL